MKNGFNVVIGGSSFEPNLVEYGAGNQPHVIVRRGDSHRGKPSDTSFVEWAFFETDFAKLDILTEALDFIRENRAGFEKFVGFEGVEYRYLNIVDDGASFEFDHEDIRMLAALDFSCSLIAGVEDLKK